MLVLLLVSDAHAPSNVVNTQCYYATHAEGHAAALKAGLDSFTDQSSDPPLTVNTINSALSQGLISQADIDNAMRHLFGIRIRLGEFDLGNPYAGITDAAINRPEHQTLARQAARDQMVLLKNNASRLPLNRTTL